MLESGVLRIPPASVRKVDPSGFKHLRSYLLEIPNSLLFQMKQYGFRKNNPVAQNKRTSGEPVAKNFVRTHFVPPCTAWFSLTIMLVAIA